MTLPQNQQENSQCTSRKIVLLSFVCAVLVLFIHSSNLPVYGPLDRSAIGAVVTFGERLLGYHIANLAVPFFFALSGFLFFRGLTAETLLPKLRRRVVSLVVPYLLWNLLYYLFFLLLTHVPAVAAHLNQGVVPLSVTELFRSLVFHKHNTVYWYLQDLIVLVVLSPALYFLFFRIRLTAVAGLAAALALQLLGWGQLGILTRSVSIYFCMGAFLAAVCGEAVWNFRATGHQAALAALVFVAATAAKVLEVCPARLEFLANILQFAGLWLTADFFTMPSGSWFLKASFFIYSAHFILLESLEKLFLLAFGKGPWQALADFLFMPVVTLAILAAVIWLCKVRFHEPRLWRLLNGGR